MPSTPTAAPGPLDHRRLLAHAGPFHPFRAGDVLARFGGQAAVDRFVDALYDRLAADRGFGTLFTRDLSAERARQKRFFGEWLGGERRYSPHAWSSLAHRHEMLAITPALADRWLAHVRVVIAATATRREAGDAVLARIEPLARALVNVDAVPADQRPGAHGNCISPGHPVNRAADLARRGDVAALAQALAAHPATLARRTYAARLLDAAANAGRVDAVRALLDAGVDANLPCPAPIAVAGPAFEGALFLTPLCSARAKRRRETAELLIARGARDDVFTAAFLGDVEALERQLAAHPELAEASDPAADALDITPLHHAAASGRGAAVALLLGRIAGAPRGAGQALAAAAHRGDVVIAEALLARGADAGAIGPGRWVLDAALAPRLVAAGASAGGGDWIRVSCTGNQGRKDDPDYVRALLRCGARADDRRGGATALHFAAKAGFVRTIAVLREHGADPSARDDDGRTPADWLERAARSVDRAAVRRALAAAL